MDVDAFVLTHRDAWDRLDQLVKNRRRLTGDEVDELVELYQRVSTHLSMLRSGSSDSALVGRLSKALPQVTVEGQTDPEVALRLVETIEYDLLITDLKMPNVNGMEVVLKACQRWPKLIPPEIAFIVSLCTLIASILFAALTLLLCNMLMLNFVLTLTALVLGLLPTMITLFLKNRNEKYPSNA